MGIEPTNLNVDVTFYLPVRFYVGVAATFLDGMFFSNLHESITEVYPLPSKKNHLNRLIDVGVIA